VSEASLFSGLALEAIADKDISSNKTGMISFFIVVGFVSGCFVLKPK
jgi:hypothetical protein